MSKKFTTAQQHYAVHEMETLAILEALQKWEDKLIGKKVHIITDHKALEFFKTQSKLSHRQLRWMNYLSKFDFDITYVKGEYNKVADCLSRYYESNTPADNHQFHEFVQVDRKLDPQGEDLPHNRIVEVKERVVEMHAMRGMEKGRDRQLLEGREQRDIEAEGLRNTNERPDGEVPGDPGTFDNNTLSDSLGKTVNKNTRPLRDEGSQDDHKLLNVVRNGYMDDKLFRLVLESPEHHPSFRERDGLIWRKNLQGDDVICVPRNRELITTIITGAHEILDHYGDQQTCEYIRRWYWWPTIVKDTRNFCQTCVNCQRAKTQNKQPAGKLHPLPIPSRPWESIGMDFIGPFPEVNGLNYL